MNKKLLFGILLTLAIGISLFANTEIASAGHYGYSGSSSYSYSTSSHYGDSYSYYEKDTPYGHTVKEKIVERRNPYYHNYPSPQTHYSYNNDYYDSHRYAPSYRNYDGYNARYNSYGGYGSHRTYYRQGYGHGSYGYVDNKVGNYFRYGYDYPTVTVISTRTHY